MEYVICYYDEYQTMKRYVQSVYDTEKKAQDEIDYYTKQYGKNETDKLFITTYDNFLRSR